MPKLQGILFDAAHVVTGAVEPIRDAGLGDRCITAAGDFFKEVPGNRERTEAEYAQLLSQAEFRLEKVIPTQSPVEIHRSSWGLGMAQFT